MNLSNPAMPVPLLPVAQLENESLWAALMEYPPFKAILPLPLLTLLAVGIVWFFRSTWLELDREATQARHEFSDAGTVDLRPAACLTITAMVLTLHEYYGGHHTYNELVHPMLAQWEAAGARWIQLAHWDSFYSYGFWAGTRIAGYVIFPFALWKLLFPKDRLVDFGLHVEGFFSHLWIYGLCLAFVIPAMLIVSYRPDFGTYYPFYKNASRSWYDLLAWESIYWAQFLALEMFFRGWMVGAMRRSLGSGAIFAMAVPYCMIHYGKPYLEAHGAIVAGVVLGSMAMRTKSIYSGALLHITVAAAMDLLSLWKRGALPTQFFPVLPP